jgi:transposase
VSEAVQKRIVDLARDKYPGFNDSHLTEKLVEVEQIAVSRETVRRLLRKAGLRSPQKRRARMHYNSVFHYLEDPALLPILKALIEESASPLKAIETDFAVDSSGFSTSTFDRWYDAKYGRMRSEHQWIKAHLMVGVKTNVVTSIEVTDGYANDMPRLPGLVATTASRFQIAEVSADKGYLSNNNFNAVVNVGATPYIPFKINSKGEGPELWRKLYHFYQFNRPEFLASYHKRSNIESTFSMIKAKFGGAVRSQTPVAQMNEVLCKVVCHNLCVLVQSIYELGIAPTFWQNQLPGNAAAEAQAGI